MNLSRLLKSNAVWALIDQIGVSACNFLLTLLVAKFLSLEGFSAFGLSLTVTLFVSALQRSYMTQPMSILGAAETSQQLAERFKAIVLLQLLAWPAVLLGVILLGSRYFPDVWVSLACAFAIAMFWLQESVRRLFFTLGEIRSATAIDIVAYGGQLCLVLLFGMTGHLSLVGFLSLSAGAYFLSFATGLFLMPQGMLEGAWPGLSRLRHFAASHWQQSKWIALSQFFMFGSYMLIPFQITEFGDALWVAQYNAANSMIKVINLIPQTIGNYLPTVAAKKYHDQGLRELERMLNKVALQMGMGALAIIGALLLVGDFMVHFLYGERFVAAAAILSIASIGPLVGMLSVVSQAGAMVLNKTRDILYCYVGGTAASFLLAPVVIPSYGLVGAVWVANIGILVPTIWHWISFKKHCRALRVAS